MAGGKSVVERLANKRVPKAVASRGAGDLVDEIKRDDVIKKLDQLLARRPARGFERVESEFATYDGGDVENVACVFGQRLSEPFDELAHAARNGQLFWRYRRGVLELSVRGHLAKNLVQEKRIPFGCVVQQADH